MSRSLKKGPYINGKLEKKVLAMNEAGKKVVVKTWARASMISPDFVGHTVAAVSYTHLDVYKRQALQTSSFMSAASFQETTKVLNEAAINGKVDLSLIHIQMCIRDRVDGAPSVVKDGLAKDEAESLKKTLEEAGAEVELK